MRRSLMVILTLTALAAMTSAISGLRAATAAQTPSESLLEYIPADTPYVYTNLQPLPEPVLAKLKSSTGKILETYQEIMRIAIEKEAEKAREKAKQEGEKGEEAEEAEETDPAFEEMMEFFLEYLSWEGLESLGIGFKGHVAIYGVSLLPVIRWELEDPDAFRAALARLEEKIGESAPRGNLEGQDYWILKSKEVGFYYAVAGNSFVGGLLPPQLEADLLPVVLGLKKPSHSLAESRRLHQVAEANGYLPYGAGYFDIHRFAEILLGESHDEYTKLLQTLGPGEVEMGEACRREVLDLTRTWPLFHGGYTEMTTGRMAFKGVLQTSPELARQLKGLVSQVPGIGTPDDGILSLGLSLNLPALRDFVAHYAESMRSSPYECKQLAELGATFEKMEAGLNEAPPPLLALGLRGVKTVVQAIDFDLETSTPRDLKAYAIVHLDNPSVAFQMIQASAPPLADLDLQPNGEPVALPEGLLPPPMPAPVLIMTENALAASIGAGSLESLQAALTADTLQPTPFLSLGYRLSEFMQLVRQQIEAEAAESGDPEKIAETQQLMGIFGIYDYLKSFALSFSFTDQGLVLTESFEYN